MDTPAFPITGGCGCGAVRFEIDAPFASASYCHCTRCQRRTGTAASVQARTAPGSFRVVRGADLIRAWAPEGGFEKAFCSECGSALFSRHPADSTVISVRLGVLDQDPGIRPQWRQFTDYAAGWEAIPEDGLPRFAEARPA